VILFFFLESERDGFGERKILEEDVPILMQQYDVIDKTVKNYNRIFSDFYVKPTNPPK